MRVLSSAAELRAACDEARAQGLHVGLVPTMGALHAGHATLVAEAARRSTFVVATVFVNPTQFGPNEDLAKYPRTPEADYALVEAAGGHALFTPPVDAMYPAGDETRVRVGASAAALCGAHRPTHFEGVTTVVAKLFALVGASTAFFGRKDYQQLKVISRMTKDLFFPVQVVGVPTVREADGLALSSRNRYLDAEQRVRAVAIARGLSRAVRAFEGGERRAGALVETCSSVITPHMDAVDYVTIADAESIVPFAADAVVPQRALLAVAARLGSARLIDNVVLGEDSAPIAPHAGEALR